LNRRIELDSVEHARLLAGPGDVFMRRMAEEFGVKVFARGKHVMVDGQEEAVERAVSAVEAMLSTLRETGSLPPERVSEAISAAEKAPEAEQGDCFGPEGFCVGRNRYVRPMTPGQWDYARAIASHDIVFATGPAGSGKTYVAVAAALASLRAGKVNRIVLVRPAVEAGEKLGFLPGNLLEKVNPYLRPLYDALQDMLSFEHIERYIDQGIIEIVPLAFMRGRTLNHAAVILDEAQNTTNMQMKMFLTRLGLHSKAAVTGDITQIDIDKPEESGLVQAREVLAGIEGIAFCNLTEFDIVRHHLVRDIVNAYDAQQRVKMKRPGK